MVITTYDSVGNITGIIHNPQEEEMVGINYVEGRFTSEEYYIKEGIPTKAAECVAVWSKLSLLADGVDIAILSGLPSPCTLIVGRKREPVKVTGGTYNFSTTGFGTWRIQLNEVHMCPQLWYIRAE